MLRLDQIMSIHVPVYKGVKTSSPDKQLHISLYAIQFQLYSINTILGLFIVFDCYK